jgi:HAD superfamily hydrolase (TIGR01509 family)
MSKVYVFDLDGTLVNSMPYFERGMLSVADDEGLKYDEETIKIITPLGYLGSAKYYISELGSKRSEEELVESFKEKLYREYTTNIYLKSGVEQYLRMLHGDGARLFVLTASPHLVTDACLKKNGVYDLFEKVWSVDDFGLTKSGTELFFEVAKTIGCEPSDVNYFDDSLIALKNATAAGYNTYGVYDRHTEEELDAMRSGIALRTVLFFDDLL